MTLAITETWVRDRVQLQDENLEDVKSLVLPGTYHEKITQLGHALYNFRRLKELDLSRNALECLDGLQHLTLLESLNLYYNNIGVLNEVHKLRFNTRLQELDLRLNPVARNEPDYRLFAIHMLPNLRRLDDRGVRDQERKAALMHFGSDQAVEFAGDKNVNNHQSVSKDVNVRAEYVSKLSVVPPIDTDDTLMMDYAQALDAPRQNGSVRAAESYERREILHMERGRNSEFTIGRMNENASNSTPPTGFAGVIDQYYPSLKGSGKTEARVKIHSPQLAEVSRNEQGSARSTPTSAFGHENHDSSTARAANNANSFMSARPKADSQLQCVMHRLCDLVDRYWNGSRSLHSHPKFIPNACGILSELTGVDEEGRKTESQNAKLVVALEKEVDELRLRLRKIEGENQKLRDSQRNAAFSNDGTDVAEMERDNERLRSEVNMMRVKLRAYEQTNELASMLRESHKALVETNDQLMRELSEARNQSQAGDKRHGGRPYTHFDSESIPTSRGNVQ